MFSIDSSKDPVSQSKSLLLLWLMVLDLPWGTEREGKLAGTELDPK
jgi:hypothetical protein